MVDSMSDKQIISEAISRIETYTANLTFEEFITKQIVIDAVIRNISVIRTIQRGTSHIVFMNNEIDLYVLWELIKKEIPIIKNEIKD